MSMDRHSLETRLTEMFPRDRGQLLPALHFLQHQLGYMPDWAMEAVGRHLRMPISEVYGAATSYTELRTHNPRKHTMRFCTGLGCWLNGGDRLLASAKAESKATIPRTGEAGQTTIEEESCGFLCAMAPAVKWDGEWQGRATVESVKRLLREGRTR